MTCRSAVTSTHTIDSRGPVLSMDWQRFARASRPHTLTRLHRAESSVNRGYLYTRGVGGAPDKEWWGWAGGVKLTRGRSPEAKALVVKLKKNSDGCTADLIDCLGRYRGWGSVIDEAGFMTNHERQSKCCLQIILSALAVLPISCFSRSQLARACTCYLLAGLVHEHISRRRYSLRRLACLVKNRLYF